jgi:hypothetical protein
LRKEGDEDVLLLLLFFFFFFLSGNKKQKNHRLDPSLIALFRSSARARSLSLSLARRFSPPNHELSFLVIDIHEYYSTKIPDLVRFASRERERDETEEEKRQPSIGFFLLALCAARVLSEIGGEIFPKNHSRVSFFTLSFSHSETTQIEKSIADDGRRIALCISLSCASREHTPSSRGAWFLPFHKKSRQRKKKKEMEGPHRKKKRIHPKKNGARADKQTATLRVPYLASARHASEIHSSLCYVC